jgi:hypothetical protein
VGEGSLIGACILHLAISEGKAEAEESKKQGTAWYFQPVVCARSHCGQVQEKKRRRGRGRRVKENELMLNCWLLIACMYVGVC